MEPQRQSGPQRAFIWEVKDFSSQLWEITPLLRIPDFLHAGAYNCFSPHVLSSCACKNLFCLGCLERQAEFSDEPWQEIRGSWGCRADFYIKASPTSLPLNVAPQRLPPSRSVSAAWVRLVRRTTEDRHSRTTPGTDAEKHTGGRADFLSYLRPSLSPPPHPTPGFGSGVCVWGDDT